MYSCRIRRGHCFDTTAADRCTEPYADETRRAYCIVPRKATPSGMEKYCDASGSSRRQINAQQLQRCVENK